MALSSQNTPTQNDQTGDEDNDAPVAHEPQVDRVAMVSRTSTGEAHQSPGFEVIGLPEDASEEKQAAAENRPAKRKASGSRSSTKSSGEPKDAKA